MATIAVDTLSSNVSNGFQGSGATLSWTHVVGSGSNSLLVVCVDLWQDVSPLGTVQSITYGGQSFTRASFRAIPGGTMRSEIWFLISPQSGSATITVTITGATDARKAAGISLFNADQKTPINVASGADGGTSLVTGSITSNLDGCLIIDTVSKFGTQPLVRGTGQTQIYNDSTGSTGGASSYYGPVTPKGTTTMSWATTGTNDWVQTIVAVQPVVSSFITKHFLYRVFDTGTYKATWTKEVITEPSFKTVINGGVSQLLIQLGRPFDNFNEGVDVKLNNKVECWVVDNDYPSGQLIFTGYISGYKPIIDEVTEKIEVTVLGYVGELQRMMLRDSGGNTTIVYNSVDPSDILTDAINKYRALGGTVNYKAGSIARTNTVVSYTFNTNTIKEVLDEVIQMCPVGWYWVIDPTNTIYLQPLNIMADHTFLLGQHVEQLETYRRVEDLVNRVLFVGGGVPALYEVFQNDSSVATYGLYEIKMIDQRVTVPSTASILANRQINSNKDPEIRSTFTIVSNEGPGLRGYNIESIRPGQTLKVSNLKTGIKSQSLWDVALWDVDVWDQTLSTSAADVIQILSVAYTPDSVILEASSRLPQIAKRIEDIQRNLEVTQVINNPSAPTPST